MKIILLLLFSTEIWSLKPNSRIIGGQEAYAGQFPHAAAIYKTTAQGNFFCNGAILSQDWIITAGQCVDGAISFTILIGTHKLDGTDATTERLATSEYVLHPDFNPLTLENDIGLIQFRAPIIFNDYITRVYLPFWNLTTQAYGIAYGWGQTGEDSEGLSNTLQTVGLHAVSDIECRLTYGNQITENMVCFAGNYNEGTCLGDSGSPIIQQNKIHHVIAAISSFYSANGCESPDPSGYTNVYPYTNWITNVTGLDS